jgi:hypothetical protein
MSNNLRTATAYLQISRDRYPYDAKVMRSTQKKPEFVEPGCVVVKVQLRLPNVAWEPFAPEAVIDVPADLVQRPVEVEAVEP